MLIYILRHGETEYNRQGIVQGGSVDTSLNDIGRAQALAFYNHYKDIDFQLVVTSDLRRTHETVQHFLDRSINWIQDRNIRELNWGDHEGKAASQEQREEFHRVIGAWNSGELHERMKGGESAQEMGQRLTKFVEWMKTEPCERLLVCSHGRAMRALICLMHGLSLAEMDRFPHLNTGTYIARLEDGKFVFEAENNVEHLDAIGETA